MQEKYPDLGIRIQSAFIDTLLVLGLIFAFTSILEKFSDVPDWVRIVLFAFVFIAYEPLFMTFGCTLGNYVKGIRVKSYADTSKRINLFQAIIRYAFKILLGWVSFLTIHSNLKRRAIHDLVSGSVMVKL